MKRDYLVATHPHADHIGSMADIVDSFDIGNVYMSGAITTTKTFENLLDTISKKGLKVKKAMAGINILKENDLSIDVLGPVMLDEENLNNSSVVIKLKYGETSFLFTGDAEIEEFESIQENLSATVLKVGHHGSRTSTNRELLGRVRPDVAIISVGKKNTYGHPHKETIKLLEDSNIDIFRTDSGGTIVTEFDKHSSFTTPSILR